MEILGEEEGFRFGLSSVYDHVGVNSKCGVQSKRRWDSHESCVRIVRYLACGCQKRSVAYETECRHLDLPFHQQTGSIVCVFQMALHAHFSVNSSAGLCTDRPTRK